MSAQAGVLEENVSAETTAAYKRSGYQSGARLNRCAAQGLARVLTRTPSDWTRTRPD
ncbi:MAG: hypothetical protein LLG14_09270 [Nocardiaceae bacterium]|nr:hypothetical protein [Nocardiaceae bacterium]